MKLSRFVGTSTRDVLRQVREALGPDALIVSNRMIDSGVEIVATLDTPSSLHAEGLAEETGAGSFGADSEPSYPEPALPEPPVTAPASLRPVMRPAMAAAYAAAAAAAKQQKSVASQEPAESQAISKPRKAKSVLPEDVADSQVEENHTPAVDLPHMRPLEPASQPMAKLTPKLKVSPAPVDKDALAFRPDMARMPDAPMPGAANPPPPPLDVGFQAGMQVHAAINAMRGSLESRMDGFLWGGANGPGSEPVNATLFRTLLEAGFSMPMVRALIERIPTGCDRQAALTWARNELVTHLPVLRSEEEFLRDGGVYALVGPTGVGKTTTLAKLAARCVARAGRNQVAMLTTDMFRIGAVEQLQIYGRLLGVPTHSVSDADELKQSLGQLGSRKFILIDTTGISQRHRNVALQAALLTTADRPIRRLLVLNAASQGDTLDEVAHAYRNGAGDDVAGCIITKLDEATRIGSSLDTAIRHRLPIHYVSVGQKVPEDMEVADAQSLVDRALAPISSSSALYAPSEGDMASLWRAAGQSRNADVMRRRQMLASALLSPQDGADVELEQAIEWLDADAACAQARANWRQTEGSDALPAPEAIAQAGMELVRGVYSRTCERYVLAVHGKAALKGKDVSAGVLHATLLMSDRGIALGAPVPQLILPHGAHAAYDQNESISNDAGEALVARARALEAGLINIPLVHLIEAGVNGPWQSLSAQGALWVSRGAANTSVVQDTVPAKLSEIAKNLGHVPFGRISARESETKETEFDIWAGGTEVEISMRGQDGALVRMVSVKLVDPDTGKTASQLYGLTNIKASQVDAGTIARWLVRADQGKTAFRHMVQAWTALSVPAGAHSLSRQALYTAHLGAACWQLLNMPDAASARHLLQAMGAGRKLSAAMLPVLLLKCFAMLEMAE